MANSLRTNPIILDTFTDIIDLSTIWPRGMYIDSIEWVKPGNVGDTFKILSGGPSGVPIFDEECVTAKLSFIRYFPKTPLPALYLTPAAGVEKASGYISIVLW